jgi:hypothetical protein
MATPANIIPVPKPSRAAYNPNRPLSRNTLVQAQVKHFAEAEKHLPPELQTGMDIASITTEGEASVYIRKVTEAIQKSGGRAGKVQRAG